MSQTTTSSPYDMNHTDEASSLVGSSCMSNSDEEGRAHSQSSMVLPGWHVTVGAGCGDLEKEIEGVAGYLSLGGEDACSRNVVRSNVQMCCGYFWASAVVKKYGSAAYGTAVPSSDIDLVVEDCGDNLTTTFYPFCMELEALGYVRIGEALTPTDAFIKLADPARSRLDINITLTTGRSPSRLVALRVAKMLDAAPSVSPVYKVLRTLLTQCKLKDATKGGLSSYALLMMVFHMEARLRASCGSAPGRAELLTAFLEYFGSECEFKKVVLTPWGNAVPRKEHSEGADDPIFVTDFTTPSFNVTAGTTKINQVRSMFKYCALAIDKWDGSHPDYEGFPSILSTFITTD
eukprot:TRINITY_DN26757_c0_g1_i1.p1 TRINITY_DN26757_c0_g1~~TRINITY_DN26757_c0_g1_i1.p1  ORF type:complete len:365 (+),score=81.24 TRINITY_DN26757_c0_g1_i1:56-1096(+)